MFHTIMVFVICTNEHVDSDNENVHFAQWACEFWIVVRLGVSQDDLSIVPCKGTKKMKPYENQYILTTSTKALPNHNYLSLWMAPHTPFKGIMY